VDGVPAFVTRNRRDLLKLMGAGGFFFATRGAFAQELTLTPAQTIGPYYPNRMPLDMDNDLLIINDAITPAVGEIAWITGRVLDRRGDPVRGALVEIWQADVNGAYIHTGSTIRNRDAGFQGYGKFITGSTGEYVFRTIKPGIYPGRTRHVHYGITAPGQPRFITQLYEDGLSLNNNDGVLNGIRDAAQRASVIVPWSPVKGSRIGEVAAKFDIVLGFTPAETTDESAVTPKIFSLAGVANAASFIPATSRGGRLAIYGYGFGEENVSVQMEGREAAVLAVSRTELHVLTPEDVATSPAAVVVSNANGASEAVSVEVRDSAMPGLFLETSGHLRAFRAEDGIRIGPPGFLREVESVPAKPGESISIFATGLASLEEPVTIRIHNETVTGILPTLVEPGYFALQLTVPELLEDGDYGVAIETAGARTEKAGRLHVRR
jgi:protocatechuate 3,4-dioxygenase, beta subunit